MGGLKDLARIHLAEQEAAGATTSNDADAEVPDVGSKFAVEASWFAKGNPVHENITIAAVRRSKMNSDGHWSNKQLKDLSDVQFELIRGIFWNDDPEDLLFMDLPTSNSITTSGANWLYAFNDSSSKNRLTQRSHFGDLQWLHCMATREGESPFMARDRASRWFNWVFDFWYDSFTPFTLFKDIPTYQGLFPDSWRVADVFTGGESRMYKNTLWKLRALGSCLHIIQDSYAKGHVKRGDNQTGAVWKTHTYKGQSDDHSHFDNLGGGALDPREGHMDSFNNIVGGHMAIQRCTEFIDILVEKGLNRAQRFEKLGAWINQSWYPVDGSQARPADNLVD